MRYQGTDIDGPRVDPDGLMVRDYDLAELMGSRTFLECFFLTMYDRFPSGKQLAELNRYFNEAFLSIDRNDPLFRIIPEVASAPAYSLNGLMAGLAVDRQEQIARIAPPDLEDITVSKLALDGFYFMSVLPIITGAAAIYPQSKDMNVFFNRLAAAQQLQGDYIDKTACLFRGNPFARPYEKRLLESVLAAFCAGFGYLTPSVMSPRISIGTGVSVGLALIAGCTTMGPWHLGTSQDVIIMFSELMGSGTPTAEEIDAYIADKLNDGKKLLGFGHPFFKKDPRVLRLMDIAAEEGIEHDVLTVFNTLTEKVAQLKNIYPNLETAHGAIMTMLGINIPFLGPSIALIGRSAGIVAHMEERLNKPAFGVRNETARNFFDKVPMGWL
ncbi:citrate/2-methylcitrate synthase [Chitinophagaceae bacterium MMS25-I14]